jgi:exodeoxyribonuclease VII large subunit
MTVSQLAQAIRRAIRAALPAAVTVRGEIANFSHQPSGHMYFSLRDAEAVLRCAMFRGANRFLRFTPENGLQVEARGEVNVYVPRGDVQLVVEEMHPAGLGAQMAALEALKAALAAEGLLAPERKRPLPSWPRQVGVVTSPRGAAVRDFLEIVGSRAPGIGVVIAPTVVQGEGAELSIAAAIERLGHAGLVDVLVVARGGGSLEDLWAFNTEPVARAIAGCPVPVVSGVGHEVDVTLADLVADVRAATPTHAAELVVPRVSELVERLRGRSERLAMLLGASVEQRRQRLAGLARSPVLRRPARMLRDDAQRLDELWGDMVRGLRARAGLEAHRLIAHPGRLAAALRHRGRLAARELDTERQTLARAAASRLPELASRVSGLEGSLRALGPSQVLGRGYLLARRAADGAVVARMAELACGERLRLDWADGAAHATVDETGVMPPLDAGGTPPAFEQDMNQNGSHGRRSREHDEDR